MPKLLHDLFQGKPRGSYSKWPPELSLVYLGIRQLEPCCAAVGVSFGGCPFSVCLKETHRESTHLKSARRCAAPMKMVNPKEDSVSTFCLRVTRDWCQLMFLQTRHPKPLSNFAGGVYLFYSGLRRCKPFVYGYGTKLNHQGTRFWFMFPLTRVPWGTYF